MSLLPTSNINSTELSLFQALLLITDGTVTDLLSVYTGEQIYVTKLQQAIEVTQQPKALQLSAPEPVMFREILLGTKAENYIYAASYFAVNRMPVSMQKQLLNTETPIGLLWKEARLETYREIVEQKKINTTPAKQYFPDVSSTEFYSRKYLIFYKGDVLGIINEQFPTKFFRDR